MLAKNPKINKILEFITLLSMIVGVVIGSGIFVKNDNQPNHVLFFTKGNGFVAIIVWGIMGILCALAMFSFVEIASSTIQEGKGSLSKWCSMFISRKTGSFVSVFLIFIYMPIIYAYFSILLVQNFINIDGLNYLNKETQELMYIFLGLTLLLFFAIINSLYTKFGKYFQIIDTCVKILPFFIIVLGSLFTHNKLNHHSVFDNSKTWHFSEFLMATGPILFSFDGFIFATNLQKETENKKLIYTALITGMIIVMLVYLIEAIALFYGTSDGSVQTLFTTLMGKKASIAVNWIIILVIFTSLNGYTTVGSRKYMSDSDDGLIYNFNKKITHKISGFVCLGASLVYYIGLNILGYVMINDKNIFAIYYLDQLSNLISIFSFLIYVILCISLIVNRFTKKIKVTKKFFISPLASVLFSLLLLVAVGYRLYIIFSEWNTSSLLLIFIFIISIVLFINNEFLLTRQAKRKKKYLNEGKQKLKYVKLSHLKSN